MGCGSSVQTASSTHPPTPRTTQEPSSSATGSVGDKQVKGCPDVAQQVKGHICTKQCAEFVRQRESKT